MDLSNELIFIRIKKKTKGYEEDKVHWHTLVIHNVFFFFFFFSFLSLNLFFDFLFEVTFIWNWA